MCLEVWKPHTLFGTISGQHYPHYPDRGGEREGPIRARNGMLAERRLPGKSRRRQLFLTTVQTVPQPPGGATCTFRLAAAKLARSR